LYTKDALTIVFAVYLEYVLQQLQQVAVRVGNGNRPTMFDVYNRSHGKEKEQCLLLCIVLNLGVSKLISHPL